MFVLSCEADLRWADLHFIMHIVIRLILKWIKETGFNPSEEVEDIGQNEGCKSNKYSVMNWWT